MVAQIKMSSSSRRSPDRSILERIASTALQARSVAVEPLDGYNFRTYRLRTSEGFFYILRCRPACHIRLLRHEQAWLDTEGGVLQSLRSVSEVQVPRLIDYQKACAPIASPYLITGPFVGSILADVEPSLSKNALASIDRSLGQYARRLSSITGPRFGPIWGGASASESWAKTFAMMLDSISRDGEDSLISLPYEGIKGLIRRHRSTLDRITQPRLVLIELASDDNVVVDARHQSVNGALDFSTAIWGDPFMSDCFYKPRAGFVEGFGRLPNKSAEEQIRQYFYSIYHSLLEIVRQSYRPVEDYNEMEARRNLTIAIRQLSNA